MASRGSPAAIDRWLRNRLEPDPAVTRRLAKAALASPVDVPRRRKTRSGQWALAAGIVAVVAGLWLARLSMPPPVSTARPRIANFGELVAVVDPAGRVWLSGPERPVDPPSPRMIIRPGGKDAP